MSGLELQRHLAAVGRRVAIVFITAYDDEQIGRTVLAAGALAILSKPFEGQLLIEAVAQALAAARS
jgi:FixJ family two-component response regulator